MVHGGANRLSLRWWTTFAAWIVLAMGRVAALLLSLGPAKLAGRNLICIREQSYSLSGIRSRGYPMWASRQDLYHQHATLVTGWALPEGRADEFLITLTIILSAFEGWWIRR